MKYPDIPYQHNHQLKGEVRKAVKPVVDRLVERVEKSDQVSQERYTMALDLIEQLAKSIKPADKVDLSGLEQRIDQLLQKDTSVSVKAPDVTVRAPAVDLTGIEKAIASQRLIIPDELDLSEYQLFTYTDGDPVNYQVYERYTGEWYIIREDVTNKEFTYAFGKDQMLAAWEAHKKLTYSTLSEAYGAVYG